MKPQTLKDIWAPQVGADVPALAAALRKPLRTLWVSQRTRVWLDAAPDARAFPFTPLVLVSASLPGARQRRVVGARRAPRQLSVECNARRLCWGQPRCPARAGAAWQVNQSPCTPREGVMRHARSVCWCPPRRPALASAGR